MVTACRGNAQSASNRISVNFVSEREHSVDDRKEWFVDCPRTWKAPAGADAIWRSSAGSGERAERLTLA